MKKTFSFRIDETLMEQVRIKANYDHRTISNYIELALINSLTETNTKNERNRKIQRVQS